jgi:hypothetical protein
VFSQFKPYKIQLQSFERYNYDGGKTIDAGEEIVPVIDGVYKLMIL